MLSDVQDVLDDPTADPGAMVDGLVSGSVAEVSNFTLSSGLDSISNAISQISEQDLPSTIMQGLDSYCSNVEDPSGTVPTNPKGAPHPQDNPANTFATRSTAST